MSDADIKGMERLTGAAEWRKHWARWLESGKVQGVVVTVILVNAVIMGMETSRGLMASHGALLPALESSAVIIERMERDLVELRARLAQVPPTE